MTQKPTYALVLTDSIPAFLQKEVLGTSGRSYGHAAWDEKRSAHVLRIPEDVYLGGAAIDIARNVAHVGNYVVYFEAVGDEAALRAEVARLTSELEEALLNQRDTVAPAVIEATADKLAEVGSELAATITRPELEAMGKSPGGFRRLRKLALEYGVEKVESINKTDALVEAIVNHLKL